MMSQRGSKNSTQCPKSFAQNYENYVTYNKYFLIGCWIGFFYDLKCQVGDFMLSFLKIVGAVSEKIRSAQTDGRMEVL